MTNKIIKCKVRQSMSINLDNKVYKDGDELEISEDTYLGYLHLFESIEQEQLKKVKPELPQ